MGLRPDLRRREAVARLHRKHQSYQPDPVHAPLSYMASWLLTIGCAVFIVALVGWATLGHQSFEAFLQWAGKAAGAR